METIALRTIKQEDQRYKTIGDWYLSHNGTRVEITTSELSDWRREFLILVHELVEYALCKHAGVSQLQVDQYDKAHEDEQDQVELGDQTEAPYRKQHCLATAVERMLAAELDVPWAEYELEIERVMETE